MSRCFPFPPPGYERQHRPEDLDLLKEAKRKEKKHKKDKKDKERKKDKEKKEKDGSDEKHRDKKDRKGKRKDKKEKHRDKKDKEDRGKEKEKSSISEESTVARELEAKSGGKLHQKGQSKDRSSSLDEGKCSALFHGQNGGKPLQSSLPSHGNEESKFVQELDRRIRDDEKGRGSQLPERVAAVDKRDQEMAARAAVRNSSRVLAEEKGDNQIKRVDKKLDPHVMRNEFSGNMMVQNLNPMGRNKVGAIPRPVDEQNGRRLEDKQKYKETGKWVDKQKDKDRESHGKEKDMENEKVKEEKPKVKTENKKSEQDKLKADGRNDRGGSSSNMSTDFSKNANSDAVNEGSMRKRKDMGANGFLHESEIRPNKLQRPALHQSIENGKKLEASRTPSKSSPDKHAVPAAVRVDNRLMNGIIEAQKPSPLKPNAAAMVSDQIAEAPKIPHHGSNILNKALKVPKMEDPIGEASRRPPHPDSKYLAEVLTVPKMADWSENDDQEWLFSKKGPSNKPKLESAVGEEDLRVWSEAVHIEAADICALPYVIPF
ncbi:DNA ligase 1 [Sesamum indicum]|uniref:DNA ligase 1 n=1 Tax=Sesamum indicum TaxID=4182 RepID=A0A6I9TJ71_SESIN|nr:DNA ligase 1 [Sesamum indicum]XP_011084209.1 DNA ligase 1 [Sesamum indicum]